MSHYPALSPWLLLLLGAALNGAAALISFWRRSVDAGGAAAGAVVGTVVFASAGPLGWLLLAVFVVSSTGMTRFRSAQKKWLSSIQEKGGRRDALQVFANGGAGMLAAVLYRVTGEASWAFALAAAFASANSDTWASEIGVLSARRPISLLTLQPVPRGISGGVTLLGLAAALGGAAVIAILFSLGWAVSTGTMAGVGGRFGLVTAAGIIGCLLDSILGSTVQAHYALPHSGSSLIVTERRKTAGVPNTLVRGWPFVTNDVVNAASTTAAALVGVALGFL